MHGNQLRHNNTIFPGRPTSRQAGRRNSTHPAGHHLQNVLIRNLGHHQAPVVDGRGSLSHLRHLPLQPEPCQRQQHQHKRGCGSAAPREEQVEGGGGDNFGARGATPSGRGSPVRPRHGLCPSAPPLPSPPRPAPPRRPCTQLVWARLPAAC